MKSRVLACVGGLLAACLAACLPGGAQTRSAEPRYSKGNELIRPANYREWIYLSSGFGMEYSASSGAPKNFTNVFVARSAYNRFLATGKWPDKTMFVLEERTAATRGSINKSGNYQGDLAGLAASVKDEERFPEKWAYFTFSAGQMASAPRPKNACWQCHHTHAAVDNTFVQFYPTLKPVARKFGVYNEAKAETQSERR